MKTIQTLITDHIDIWTAAETEKKSGRGRSAGNAGSVYGIKKLRELILELAVRGKLVPQDANDLPASDFLKRIQAEKARLLAEGKIRKDKPLAAITEDEKPFELPNGWEWVMLDDIGNTFIGLTYSPKDISKNGTPVLRSSNIQNGKIDLIDLVRVDGNIKSNLFVDEGDLLICARNGSKSLVGKTAMIKNLNEPMVFGAFMAIFKSQFNFYIEVFLNSPVFRNFLDGVATTTINQITQNNLKTTLAPLPPLAEQHRIVAKVDELMALCDQLETRHSNAAEAHETLVSHLLGTLTHPTVRPELVEGCGSTGSPRTEFEENWQRIAAHFDTLFTTDSSIEALKQTLLQLAVMGKLVPQDPADEPASELLKRIQAEKTRLIAEGKIKKDKPLPPIADDEKPFNLPQGWEWARLGFIGNTQTGATPSKSNAESFGSDIPFVKPGDIYPNYVEYNNEGLSFYGAEQSGRIAQSGSLLMVCIGTIGKCNLIERDCTFNQQINSISPYLFDSRYLLSVCRSVYFYTEAWSRSSSTTIAILNKGNWEKICIPIPPLAEQHRIVAKVDELMALCDQLKSRITDARQLQQKLADVMVEQACGVKRQAKPAMRAGLSR